MAAKKEFLLRIDPALWQELQKWADDEFRSVNGQIEFLLRDAIHRNRKKDINQQSRGEAIPDHDQ